MTYLIFWDSSCIQAGSVVPPEVLRIEVASTKRDAMKKFELASRLARKYVEHDVNLIRFDPRQFRFESGYCYLALAVALPKEVTSVEAAQMWLADVDKNEKLRSLNVLRWDGGHLVPPRGEKKSASKRECLEILLDYVR